MKDEKKECLHKWEKPIEKYSRGYLANTYTQRCTKCKLVQIVK